MKPILVRDLALERWYSMDRYADSLAPRIPGAVVPDAWTMTGPRYLTRAFLYPRALRAWRHHGDLVHVLDHSYAHCLRSFRGMPSLVTVHDLLPLRLLAEDQRSLRLHLRDRLLRWVLDWLERADRFIVSTAWTGRELERYLHIAPERIHVVPYGVDDHFRRRPAESVITGRRAAWAKATGRNADLARVILHVGTCAPRKNLEAAIAALGMLRQRGADAILVQIGGQWGPHHQALMAAQGVAAQVVQEHRISEEALVSAYHAADVLVMPSTFEGFGLPAVEAMAAGLPVVTSGAGGLRDAVGDAALVTRATDAASLAEAIGAVLEDPVCRNDMVARGRRRAAQLTWDRTAQLTLGVYETLAGARGRGPEA